VLARQAQSSPARCRSGIERWIGANKLPSPWDLSDWIGEVLRRQSPASEPSPHQPAPPCCSSEAGLKLYRRPRLRPVRCA
jgi:hypothetical protein